MKNNKILIILFLIFLPIKVIFPQFKSAEIIYKKMSLIEFEKTNKPDSDGRLILKEAMEIMKKFQYSLKFNKSASFFEEVKQMSIENEGSMSYVLAKIYGGTDGTFYTLNETGRAYILKEFEGELFLIEHPKITDWKLTQEKKKIGNYTCYKATKNDIFIGSSGEKKNFEVLAWYTPEIPFSYGPIKYNGLPGLILELKNRKTIIYASKIVLNKDKEIEINKPTKKYKQVRNTQYDSIIMGMAKDFNKKYKRN